ncbi:hypothetical protein GGR55DRAFT_347493 [Xylaria sp. FL0064]|nr:hypothetical protein GGR55DRAFT_347493 [Xylaria sp. FL0064]
MSLLNSFPLFVRLPPELRLTIWETFAGPRTIHILHAPGNSEIRRRRRLGGYLFINVPILFFINIESREVAERLYTQTKFEVIMRSRALEFGLHFDIPLHVRAGDELRIHDVDPSFRAVRAQRSGEIIWTMNPCPFIDRQKIYRWVDSVPDECISAPRESLTGDFLSGDDRLWIWVTNGQFTRPTPQLDPAEDPALDPDHPAHHPCLIHRPNPAQQPNLVPRFFDFEATGSLARWTIEREEHDEAVKRHVWVLDR